MKKLLLVLPGYCVGLGGLVLITVRTLLAVGSASKTITLQVNRFGEQYLDVVSLVFLWLVCLIGLLCLLVLVRENEKSSGFHTSVSKSRVYCDTEESRMVSQKILEPLWTLDESVFEGVSDFPDGLSVALQNAGTGGVFSVLYPF